MYPVTVTDTDHEMYPVMVTDTDHEMYPVIVTGEVLTMKCTLLW